MLACPIYNDPNWIKTIQKIGIDNARRLFEEYKHLDNPHQALANDLDPENITTDQKKTKLETHAAQLGSPVETRLTPDGELVRIYQGNGKSFTPMSTELDTFPNLSYQGPEVDDRVAAVGTKIHSVFERIVKEDLTVGALETEFPDVPKSFLNQAKLFVEDLKTKGVVLSELPLSMSYNNIDVAGTPDLILLKDNGAVEVYDFKTIHQKEKDVPPIWDITSSRYKGPRYTTQLMGYGEFIKDIVGTPVTDHKIVPISVFYDDPKSQIRQISKIEFVNQGESVNQYGYVEGAKRDLDKIFNRKRTKETFNLATAKDISDDLITDITGLDKSLWTDLSSKEHEARAIIDDSLQRQDAQANSYYHPRRGWIKFKSKDRGERINQVIREAINVERAAKRDIYLSLKNAIKTGEDPLTPRNAQVIPKLLREYKNTSFEVADLTTFKGFEDKTGWMVLRRGNRLDLIYAGTEYMLEPIPNGHTNFFQHLNPFADDHYGRIDNNVGELKSVEGLIIASQLLQENEGTELGRISLYSETGSAFPYVINPLRIYDSLKKVSTHQNTPEEVKNKLEGIVKISRDRLMIDYIQAYMDLVQDIRTFAPTNPDTELSVDERQDLFRRNRLLQEFARFQNMSSADRAHHKSQLKDQLLREISTLKSMNYRDDVGREKELEHLSFLYLQLNGIDLYGDPISNKVIQKLSSRTLKAGAIMDFINERITTQKADFKDRFLAIQEGQNIPAFNKYFKESGFKSYNITDRLFSPTTRFYEPLFERKTVLDESSGREVEVNSYRLVQEGSAAYYNLTPAQREFHDFIRGQIEKIAGLAGMESWDGHNIPLMHNSLGNSIYKNLRNEGNVRTAVKEWWEQLTENTEFLNHRNNSGRENTGEGQSIFQLSNWFRQQLDEGFRNKSLGIHGTTVPDISHYNSFETNLEKILIAFLANSLRIQTMNKLASEFAVAHTAFQFYQSNLFGNEYQHNIQEIEDLNTILVQNQDVDRGSVFNKLARGFNRVTSYVTLAGNFKAGAIVAAGQQFLAASRAISNSWIPDGKFNLNALRKAAQFQINPKTRKLANSIIDHYGIQDADTTALMSDLHQTGNKSIMKSKYLYGMFRLADRWSKGDILLGMMFQDGSINAYSLNENGELIYNEEDDPRFIGEDGQALKEAIQEQLAENGRVREGKMIQGYDMKTVHSIQAELALLFGGQDRDLRAPAAFSAAGRLFYLHKHFFPSIFSRAIAGRAEFDAYGGWEVYTDEEGKRRAKWTKGVHEGIFTSLIGIGAKLLRWKKNRGVELSDIEQKNLKRITADMIVFASFMVIAKAIEGALDDEEPELAKISSDIAWGVMSDLLLVYNVEVVTGAFQPVAIDVVYNSVRRLFDSFGTSVKEGNGAFFDQAMQTLAPTRSVQNMVDLMDQLNE